ncbi:putative E3 ubiquitin-protein ligase MID2 [Saccoglossus kowalevskii]
MGDSLERELSCAVCMELYTDPLLLPCAHSFCRSCLPDVLKRNSNQKSGHSRLVCPSCRFTVELDKRGIDGLPRNFLLDNIIERYKEEKSTDGRPVKVKGVACDVCADSGGAKASKTCIQCGVSYCDRCLRTYHPSKGVFSKHKLVKATRNPKRKDVYCPEHDDELIKMYCVQCKTPVCYLCDRFGGHKGHQVAELKTSYKLMKETLSSNLAQLVSKMANVNEFIITLERKGESIQTNAAVMHQRISEEFAVIKAMLEQRERVMHTKISEETARKLLLLKQQNMACQDKLHNTAGLIQYTREVLKEEVPAALLLTGASLDDRLNCAIDSCPQLQPNTADDFSHVILNLEYEKQIIQKMDLLTIKGNICILVNLPEFEINDK